MSKPHCRLGERKVALITDRMMAAAQIVIELSSDGAVTTRWNEWARVPLLIVVGPGIAWENEYARAILCEVGLRRTRPYRQAYIIGSGAGRGQTRRRPIVLPRRGRHFPLTRTQYEQVAPALFLALAGWAERCVSKWKNPTFTLPQQRLYYAKKGRWLDESVCKREWPRGVRVHVDPRDTFLMADLHRAEQTTNRQRKEWRRGIVRRIGLILQDARVSRRRIETLKPYHNAVEFLRKLSYPRHLVPRLEPSLARWIQGDVFQRILGAVFNGDLAYWQDIGARADGALPGAAARLGDLQVFYLHKKEEGSHTGITFDLWASPKAYQRRPEFNDLSPNMEPLSASADDVPF